MPGGHTGHLLSPIHRAGELSADPESGDSNHGVFGNNFRGGGNRKRSLSWPGGHGGADRYGLGTNSPDQVGGGCGGGIEIYREEGGKIPILYSGGSGDIFDQIPIEASLAREYALTTGIPRSDFLIETTSRNTYENIRETKKILDREFPDSNPHRIFLVTSSVHMPRAILIAKKAGIIPIPKPSDFLLRSPGFNLLDFLPSAETFLDSTRCLNEWLGIVAYRIMGRL